LRLAGRHFWVIGSADLTPPAAAFPGRQSIFVPPDVFFELSVVRSERECPVSGRRSSFSLALGSGRVVEI
jgi:hypothetical protein